MRLTASPDCTSETTRWARNGFVVLLEVYPLRITGKARVGQFRHPSPLVRAPAGSVIHAPEFPPKMEWVNVAFLRMAKLAKHEATLVEFFDVARVNSHRTLPYLREWHARYGDRGLRVI